MQKKGKLDMRIKNYRLIIPFMFLLVISLNSCSMDNLPKGDFIESYSSPNKTYTINSYLCSGNATTDFSIRCEAVEVSSGKTWNIYWNYHEEEVNVKWIDETNVIINNHKIDILKDSYDWRSE